jgi:hypothetical protein
MSAGHHQKHDLSETELDDLLAEALANPKIKKRLERPFKLITNYDIALVGSSSIGGAHVYFDRHLHDGNKPVGFLSVGGKILNTRPGLTRHERLEQALEDELGWPYDKLAHPVAQKYEEKDYRAKGFDPKDVEKAFAPFIKADAHERIKRSPTDLDMRPLMAPPVNKELIAKINECAQREKRPHEAVGYEEKSTHGRQKCGSCSMMVKEMYGGPACIDVQSPIHEGGWCRRFRRGSLDKMGNGNG